MDRIDALRMLIDVAETKSFSGVARKRAIAISTVGLAVAQLEQEFGTSLLIRSTRKLAFTHKGEALLLDARRIVSDWDAALRGVREDGPLAGPITVTATNDFGRFHVRPLLDRFQERYPGVHVTLLLNDSAVDLIENQTDLALRSGPLPDSTLKARLLMRGRRLVCASPSYWAHAGKPARPEDLVAHNCMILARPGAPLSPWPFLHRGRTLSVKVSGDRQSSDGDVLREWACEGRGVVFKNIWDIRDDLAAGRLESALEEFSTGPVDLFAVHAAGASTRRLSALIDFLAEALREPAAV